jgi:stage II sporulation protein P
MSKPQTQRTFVVLMISVAFIFAIFGSFAVFQAENSTSQFSKITSGISAKTLAMLMSNSLPYLGEKLPFKQDEWMVSRLFLEIVASIDPKDPRTLIGGELPLFALFDTDIAVASADADFTSIPIESPPPPELEKEIMKAMEKEGEKDQPITNVKGKKVFIYHTHWWESYLPELGRTNPNQASDVDINIMQVGKHLADTLERMGVGAQMTRKPITGWQSAYANSRKLVIAAMKQNKDLEYFIDIHRDSKRRSKTTIVYGGKPYARLAFVVGKSSTNYPQNLKLAKELYTRLNELVPGICTGVYEKARASGNNGEYNQSLSPNSMLVEVGGIDNTFEEADRSIDVLAKVIAERVLNATPVMGQPK